MNIGIVGLLPEQVRFVQQEFPGHALKFLSKDNESEMSNFAKGCDKVVLMTKFIGHHIQDRVQPSKRILLTGGITKLKATLQKLPSPVKTTTPPKPTHTPTVKPGADVVDWSPLYNATEVGQVIRIARPPRVSLAAFETRIRATRSYIKKHKGILTTPTRMVDGFAVMTIKEIRNTTPADEQEPAPPNSEGQAMQLENLQVGMPVVQAVERVSLSDSRAAAFWQSVFLETVKQWPGAPVDLCAQRADEAVSAYRKRIGNIAMQ